MDRKTFKTQPQTLVTDPRSGEIKKIIHPADTEIGLDGLPRDLTVHGEIIGSIQQTADGLPYLVAGTNVQITSGSNGQVTIGASGAAGAPSTVAYVTIGNDAALSAERALTVGTGLRLTDGGPDSNVTLDVKDNVYASLTGSNSFSGAATFSAALSGSIQRTSGGVSYLVGGTNVTVTTGSNGQITIAAAAASGAPSGGQYITLATDPGLSAERVLSPSTGLFFTDGGANGNYAIGVNDSVFAALSGANFTGPVNFAAGQVVTFNGALSGSLSRLPNGLSFLAAGPNTTITTSSNGQVTISSTGGTSTGGGDADPSYLTLALTASLSNERVFTPGTGLKATDAGANGAYTLNGDDSVFATVSGSTFTGPVVGASAFGFTGSLTKLVSGAPFLTSPSGNVVTLLTGSGGQVIISGSGGANQGAPLGARYLTLAADAELTSERLFTPGAGIKATDGGAGGAYTVVVHDGTFAALTGSNFTGPVSGSTFTAGAGFTGSLTKLSGGVLPFITVPAGNMITVTTGSNGQIILSGSGDGTGTSTGAPASAQYITLATDASLTAERVLVPSTGLFAADGGANGNYTIGVNDRFFAALTGSVFSGPIVAAAAGGVTGSITQLVSGAPFITSPAGNIITVTTGSGGQIIISGSGDGTGAASSGGGGDPGAQYLTLALTASLSNERVFTPSTGLFATDAGANGAYSIGVNDRFFAALTGANFTGAVSGASITAGAGFTGSLTRLLGGVLPFITTPAGNVVTVTTGSNGQIVLSGSGGANQGAPLGARYLALAADAELTQERVFTPSTGLFSADAGAGGAYTLGVNDRIFAALTGAAFSGPIVAASAGGITGSITQTTAGTPFITVPAGNGISITTGSNGQIILSGSSGGSGSGAPLAARYITLALDATLTDERVLTPSTGIFATDGGAGAAYTFGVNDRFFAALTGSNFSGVILATGGVSGSLQKTTAGLSYLVGSQGVTVASASNGQVTLGADNGILATISGSTFTGAVTAASGFGFTGSLTKLVGGAPFITVPAGNMITVTTGSGGQIIISGSGDGTGTSSSGGGGDPGAQYLVLAATASLSAERVLTPGTGLKAADTGANGSYTLTVHDGTFAALTGSIFTGAVSHDAGGVSALLKGTDVFFYVSGSFNLASGPTRKVAVFGGDVFSSGSISAPWFSGSIQLTQAGLPYLVGQGATVISSQSNGQIFISSSAGTGAPAGASSTFQINASGSFSGSTGFTYDLVANRPVAGVGGLELSNLVGTFGTVIKGAAVAADRVASLPLLAGNDTFTMDSFAATLSNKTLTAPNINTPNFSSSAIISTGEGRFGKIYTSGTLQVGASSPTTIAAEQVMWVSGSSNLASGATRKVAVFGGDVIGSGSFQAPWFSGSIQQTFAGLSYLVASGAISITSQSNGQIKIFAAAGGGAVVGSDTQVIFNDGGAAYAGDSGFTFNKTTDALTVASVTASLGLSSSFAQLAGTNQGGYLALVGGAKGRAPSTGTLRLGGGNGVYVDHIVAEMAGADMTFLQVHNGASIVNVGDPNYYLTWQGYRNSYAVNSAEKHYFSVGPTQVVSFDVADAVFAIGISGSVGSFNDHLALHGGGNPVANTGTIRTGYDADSNFPLWRVLDSNLVDRDIIRYGGDILTIGGTAQTRIWGESSTEIRGTVVQIAGSDGTLQSEFYPGLGYIGGTPHSFDSNPSFTQAAAFGTDVWLHVSGSRNTTPARTTDVDPVSVDRHVAVFGGDVVMSGSISLTTTPGHDGNIWLQQNDVQYEVFNGNESGQQWFGSSAFNVFLRGYSTNIYGYSAGCAAYDGRNGLSTDLAVVSQYLTGNMTQQTAVQSGSCVASNLTFPVNAGEIWSIEFNGSVSRDTSANGVSIGLIAPTGSNMFGAAYGVAANDATITSARITSSSNYLPVLALASVASSAPRWARMHATVIMGANSGNITVIFGARPDLLKGGKVTLHSGSMLFARRLNGV